MPTFRKSTDMLVTGIELYFIPVQTRVPLKFGTETLTSVTEVRVKVTVRDEMGNSAVGVGESPLSVQWGWPSSLPYEVRHQAMRDLCGALCQALLKSQLTGHAIEIGYDFQQQFLTRTLEDFSKNDAVKKTGIDHIPHLAALLCLAHLIWRCTMRLGSCTNCPHMKRTHLSSCRAI